MSKMVKYEGDGEWSALYVGDRLDKVGDHYLITERIEELAGVEVIQSNDFLQGGNHYDDVAKTLSEVREYTAERERLQGTVEEMRAQAAKLLAEAQRLEDQR